MKNFKIFKLSFLIICLWAISACTTDFDEINENPNDPTVDKAAPDQLLTNAIEAMTDRVHEIFLGHEMGSCWVQQMAKCQYTDEDRYVFRPDVVNNTWTSFYATSGQDIDLIYKLGVKNNNPNYQAVGIVLKVYVSSVLTDLFGDVPYSQAWKGDEGIISPAYDTQQDIYTDMIAKLATANTLFDEAAFPIAGDILYGNDIALWKKFTNSLRLRLLLRSSGANPGAAADIAAMVGAPATYPIFTSNADNAALVYLGSAPNNNPINENRKTRDDHRVSENFINLELGKYGDWRVLVFAMPSEGSDEFVGMPNGLTSADAAAFNGNGLANTSKIGEFFTQAEAPGVLMSYAELEFILAEAAKKGYIAGGDATAKTHYDAGITANFEYLREPLQAIFDEYGGSTYGDQDLPAGYTVDDELDYALTAGAPYVAANALQLIAEQRYIATFDQGLQSWFEWRRTGFPVLTPAIDGTNGGKIPVRVPYPLNEASLNSDNMNAAIGRQGADDLNTRVWWDIN